MHSLVCELILEPVTDIGATRVRTLPPQLPSGQPAATLHLHRTPVWGRRIRAGAGRAVSAELAPVVV
jgi:hypothetical protein